MVVLMSALAEAPEGPGLKVWLYGAFVAVVAAMLALDLGIFHRKAHVVSFREALGWTAVWVGLAMAFNVAVYFLYEDHVLGLGTDVPVLGRPGATTSVSGWEAAKLFLTGYVVEESLSLDNVFVIAVILASLRIPAEFQHRVLFWGILGAMVIRGIMIFVGAELVARFSWVAYLFGGILILTAVRMSLVRHGSDPAAGWAMRLTRRLFPVTDRVEGQHFFTVIDGKRFATPLLVALLMVEFTDVVFAVDSIPAIFAITADPFLVFTSNIFAILGLRSMYFALAAMMGTLRFLKPALILVLFFVGTKMCLVHTPLKIPTDVSLAVVLGTLGTGVAASLVARRFGGAVGHTGSAVRRKGAGDTA
jgi:tellurite resistance protein TerC